MPPQLLTADNEYYTAIVMHEMAHAYQGNVDYLRVDEDEHIRNVCSNKQSDKDYNEGISNEAKYLSLAMKSENEIEIMDNLKEFIKARDERRIKCNMSADEIVKEKEFEWLEGCGRYVEYCASRNSNSIIAKGLDDIEKKVAISGDDKYYTLGMAQYYIINKLSEDWEKDIIEGNMTLEDYIRKILRSM